jgi:hypothetical protein
MPRDVTVVLLTCAALFAGAASTSAQGLHTPAGRDATAPSAYGRLFGIVTDEAGQRLTGVSVLAMGTSLLAVTTDGEGRFSLLLPAGQYVLRVARDGYVSSYREPIRVQTDGELERRIRLQHAGQNPDGTAGGAVPADDEVSHSESAWRLRHLSHTVLRDESPGQWGLAESGPAAPAPRRPLEASWRDSPLGAGPLTLAPFSGQVNVYATQTMDATGRRTTSTLPANTADVIVGAPVGSFGDWSVRGVMASSDLSSWMVLGEFRSRSDRRHAIRFGMSYSQQELAQTGESSVALEIPVARSVGGVYGGDRWQVTDRVALDYGLRFNRYDYLAEPSLLSSYGGIRWRVVGRTFAVGGVQRRMVAPASEQFLPPTASGLWLPPERTFSPLTPGALRAERVDQRSVGVEHEFISAPSAGSSSPTRGPLSVRATWFSQTIANQLAAVFGADDVSSIGHYYVARAGSADITGWKARVTGSVSPHVKGSLEYVAATADWQPAVRSVAIRQVAPSVLRAGRERLHDLVGTLDVSVAETGTQVAIAYRISTGFSVDDAAAAVPETGGRVKVELRQQLPYQPIRGGTLHMLFAVRTLLRDPQDAGSLYDELLTVMPPLRLTGGVQVQF